MEREAENQGQRRSGVAFWEKAQGYSWLRQNVVRGVASDARTEHEAEMDVQDAINDA